MPFIKGQSGNPAGRKKGSTNARTKEFRSKVHKLLDENWVKIETDLAFLDPKDRLDFMAKLLPYVLPRLQSIELPEPAESHKHIDLSDVPTDILKELSDAKDKALPYLKYKDDNGRNLPPWLADDGDLLQ